jgi:LmbE family N-acetylglucosaminyl deacetylase
MMPEITTRLLVVSPHFDDGIFGCGSLLAAHADATVATVFAGMRKLDLYPDFLTDWDRQCGFSSSREAMRARLAEDDGALKAVDAAPIRMPSFYDSQYGSPVPVEEIADELERLVVSGNFATILFPLGLFHSDHVLVSDASAIVAARQPERAWFLYEEALYRRMAGLVTQRLAALRAMGYSCTCEVPPPPATHLGQCQALKLVAVRHYASQLRAFGPGGYQDIFAAERFWRISRGNDETCAS